MHEYTIKTNNQVSDAEEREDVRGDGVDMHVWKRVGGNFMLRPVTGAAGFTTTCRYTSRGGARPATSSIQCRTINLILQTTFVLNLLLVVLLRGTVTMVTQCSTGMIMYHGQKLIVK